MNRRTLWPIRAVFIVLCTIAGFLVCYASPDWQDHKTQGTVMGFLIGCLVLLTDVLLKGFSLRGLSAVTFGLAIGSLIAYLVGNSPLFAGGDPQYIYITQLALYLIVTYLCTVIALRGKDEFNLVIPYVRFEPQDVERSQVVVDTSALIDGRLVKVYEAGFLSGVLVIPSFVLDELQSVAASPDPQRQARGRKGLEILGQLRKLKNLEIQTPSSDVAKPHDADAKLVFLARSLKAKLLTTDYGVAKLAEFHGVPWLNLNFLQRALRSELTPGEMLEIELVKPGKEEGQAVGYLEDGSMVVVSNARSRIGSRVLAEIMTVLPSAGGRMVFGRLAKDEGLIPSGPASGGKG